MPLYNELLKVDVIGDDGKCVPDEWDGGGPKILASLGHLHLFISLHLIQDAEK